MHLTMFHFLLSKKLKLPITEKNIYLYFIQLNYL